MSTDRTENIEKCITVQQQRRKARVSQEKRASDNDFAMSSTTVPKTEILFAHRILHFLHEKKVQRKKHVVIKNSVLQFKIHYSQNDHRYFLIVKCNIGFGVLSRCL